MPGGSGGGGTTYQQVEQKMQPWERQRGPLSQVYSQAFKKYEQRDKFYPRQTYANLDPNTMEALRRQAVRSDFGTQKMYGVQLTDDAQRQLLDSIRGKYLDEGNPHFQRMAEEVRAQVQPAISSRFSQAGEGAVHSPLAARAMGRGITSAIGDLAYRNYGDERLRQMQSVMQAPALAREDYADIAKRAEVGAALEDQRQRGINEAIARHDFKQYERDNALARYAALIQGYNPGYTTVGTQTARLPRQSIGANLLGGGLGGATLGSMIGPALSSGSQAGPIGALVGGGLGLLSGLF